MSKLYVENSVGRSVTDAFNKFRREHRWEAVFQHDMHPQMQQRQTEGDGWWIKDVTAQGFAIVSCDLAVVENDDERRAVIDSEAQIVAFALASYNRWHMMRGLARHWLSIERHLRNKASDFACVGRRQGSREVALAICLHVLPWVEMLRPRRFEQRPHT